MMDYIKLDDTDRRAIVAYQNACRAGWSQESCRFIASTIVEDPARLNRILYQALVSEPVAFRPSGAAPAPVIRAVDG